MNFFKTFFCIFISLSIHGLATTDSTDSKLELATQSTSTPESQVMLQAFDWESISNGKRGRHYDYLKTQINQWNQDGFNLVWLPPHMDSADSQGYAPGRWYLEINKNALLSITSQMKSNNMTVLADMIFNHRTAPSKDACTGKYTAFEGPYMGNWAVVSNDGGCNGNDSPTCPDACGCGSKDTGENNCGFPDLDHTEIRVQNLIKEYLDYARSNLGITGYRWDQSKGYRAEYAKMYNDHGQASFAVAEIYDGSLERVKKWIQASNSTIPVFDFPLYFILKRSVRSNNYVELMGVPSVLAWNSGLAVTFTANHDTQRSGSFGLNDEQNVQGYVYILTHPGVPCVFWTDYQSTKYQAIIKSLVALRKTVQVHANSPFTVVEAKAGIYAAYVTGIKGKLAVLLGNVSWTPSSTSNSSNSFKLEASGSNYKVWSI